MKIMCISDIHGDINCLEKALARYAEEKADKLIILGDFFSYYNSPSDYGVVERLNPIASDIIAVMGNCDDSYSCSDFDFEVKYIQNININNIEITLTHGHMYNPNRLPNNVGEIFMSGHTHIGSIRKEKGIIFLNPGSISKPRGGSENSYIIMDEKKIELKRLDGSVIDSINIK